MKRHRPLMPSSRYAPALSVLVLGVALGGCSDLADRSPLTDARSTPEALARAALDALEAGDDQGLRRLMIGREEYEETVWPHLPDRHHMPFAFAWSMNEPRSRKARLAALRTYSGVPLELVRVELGAGVERHEALTLYHDARMVVRFTDTGEEGVLPLMDTLIRMDGGWKFMNFTDDR